VIDRESIHYWLRHADHAMKESGVQVPLYDTIDEPGWAFFCVLVPIALTLIFCAFLLLILYSFITGNVEILRSPTPH